MVIKNNRYFYITWLLLLLILSIKFPTLSYHSALSYEDGTNYLHTAINEDLLGNILTVDAGYLVILPRLISYLTYNIFPLYWYPFITNITGLLFISFFASFFSKEYFRTIISSDIIRAVVCLIIGIGFVSDSALYYYEYVYRNFSYWGMIFCFLIIFVQSKCLNTRSYIIYAILVSLICASKFHLLIFFPIYIFYLIYRRKFEWMFVLPLLSMSAQILHTIMVLKSGVNVPSSFGRDASIVQILLTSLKGIVWYFQAWANFFPFVVGMLFFIAFVSIAFKLYQRRLLSFKHVEFLLCANVVAIFNMMISCLGPMGRKDVIMFGMSLEHSRYDFTTLNMILLSVAVLSSILYQVKWKKLFYGCLIFACFFCISNNFPIKNILTSDIFRDYKISYSDWDNTYSLLNNKDYYFVPVNHDDDGEKLDMVYLWAMKKDIDILKSAIPSDAGEIDISDLDDDQKIYCLYVEYPKDINLIAIAYDGADVIEIAKSKSNDYREHKFLYFSKPIKTKCLKIVSENDECISFSKDNPVLILGQ